jgi:hypothetical protein
MDPLSNPTPVAPFNTHNCPSHEHLVLFAVDRFWYENPGVFTPAQKTALRSASLASVICENTGITSVPKDSFSLITARNPLVLCSNIPRINLLPWKEQPGKRASSGEEQECG